MPTNIDYEIYNYCSRCDQRFLKPINRCQNSWCRTKLRIMSRSYGRLKRQESSHRY